MVAIWKPWLDWNTRIAAGRCARLRASIATVLIEIDAQTAFYLELELKGLSRLGGGLETLLQNSIIGYQPIRY